jgi:hypothetical protein
VLEDPDHKDLWKVGQEQGNMDDLEKYKKKLMFFPLGGAAIQCKLGRFLEKYKENKKKLNIFSVRRCWHSSTRKHGNFLISAEVQRDFFIARKRCHFKYKKIWKILEKYKNKWTILPLGGAAITVQGNMKDFGNVKEELWMFSY